VNRAKKILESLQSYEESWTSKIQDIERDMKTLAGDTLLFAAIICYLGPFQPNTRNSIKEKWIQRAKDDSQTEDYICGYNAVNSFYDSVQVNEWKMWGLSLESHTIENIHIIINNPRWPFIIDPEGVANEWIRKYERANHLRTVDAFSPNLMEIIEAEIVAGRPILIENNSKEISNDLETLLTYYEFNCPREDASLLQFRGREFQYNGNFRLYITTQCLYPNISEEMKSRVNVVQFEATLSGLSEQLLDIVTRNERPDIQAQKDAIVERYAADKREYFELEKRIVDLVCNAEGTLVEDEMLVNELYSAKSNLISLQKRISSAQEVEAKCDKIRDQYRSVATRGALLYEILR
jgi:dynein heavy chain